MHEILTAIVADLPIWVERIVTAVVTAVIAVTVALLTHRILFRVLKRLASASESEADDIVLRRLARPSRYALVALGLVLAARETPWLEGIWEKIAGFGMPALVGWVALAVLNAFIEAMELRADISVPDNRDARRRRTRLTIFGRIGSFVIVFLTVGLMLLSIPGVRDIGVTLMASAGVAALAVGAAAQPALKALVSGFQMALTEPISIDDIVIINGEWGRVEDIRTTFVIVRTWDERRLVVPSTKFLEETFQNWTREGAELLAPVMLYLDPMTDIAPLRAEFERQVAAHPLWDNRVGVCQVTDCRADSIEVRFLMSAKDSGDAFTLRCDIRESMLAWVRENQPQAAVRRRVETAVPVAVAAAGGD